MEEVCEFLKKCGVYYLATLDGNQPRVRPFGTVNIFEDKLYIQTGKSKDVFKQIMANPNVEVSGFVDGVWIRLSGKLIHDDRREARKSMLDAYPNLRVMYNEDDGNTAVLCFENATAIFCSFTGAPKLIKF